MPSSKSSIQVSRHRFSYNKEKEETIFKLRSCQHGPEDSDTHPRMEGFGCRDNQQPIKLIMYA